MSLIKAASHYGLGRKRYKFEMKIHRLILPTSANKLLARVLWIRRNKHSEQYKTNWTEGTEEFDMNQCIIHIATIFLTAKTNQFQSKQTTVCIQIRTDVRDRNYSKYCSIKLDLSDFISIQHPNKIFCKHLRYKNNKGTKKAELIFSIMSTELTNNNENSSFSSNDNTSYILSAEDTSYTISDQNLSSNKDAWKASVVTHSPVGSPCHSANVESIPFQQLKRIYVGNQRRLCDSSNPILAANKSSHVNVHNNHRQQHKNANTSPIKITRHSTCCDSYDILEQHKKPASPYILYPKYAQRQQGRKYQDDYEQKKMSANKEEQRLDYDDNEEEKDKNDDDDDEPSENPPPFLLHIPCEVDEHESFVVHRKKNYDKRSSIIKNCRNPISNDTPMSLNQQWSGSTSTKNGKGASISDLRYNHHRQIDRQNQKQKQKHPHKHNHNHKNGKKKRKSVADSVISLCSTDDEQEENQNQDILHEHETTNYHHFDSNLDLYRQLSPLRGSYHDRPYSRSLLLRNRDRNRSLESVSTVGSVDLDGFDLVTMTAGGSTVTGGGLSHDELEELRQLRLDKMYYQQKMIESEKMGAKLATTENEMEALNKKIKTLQHDNNMLQLKVGSLQTLIEQHKNEKANSFGTFKYMTYDECDRLKIGDYLDHRDETGHVLLAKIINKKKNHFHIHYEGYTSKRNTWINYKNQTQCADKKIAMGRSISRKSNTRFVDIQIGDNINIHPKQRHEGWRPGKIKKMDKYSGQVQVEYLYNHVKHFYWAHLNDVTEIAPFMTRAIEI